MFYEPCRIIFTSASDRVGDAEIYVMKADGSEQTRLIDNGGESRVWSPDGTRIAITSRSTQNGNWDIYVMNADGSQRIRLTNNGGTSPSWSPDGTQIAFVANRDGKDAIYVMKADGSQQTRLTNIGSGYPIAFAWSPDSARIAFADGGLIFVMNADGSGLLKLNEPSSAPLWLGILLPALLHLILIAGLISPQLYIRRHTQQAITLILLRVVSTMLFVGLMGEVAGGLWGTIGSLLWFLVNGSLWLFGGIWGLHQVSHGDCWLMRLRSEKDLLPCIQTEPEQVPITPSAP